MWRGKTGREGWPNLCAVCHRRTEAAPPFAVFEDRYYEQSFDRIPYVADNDVYLFSGEAFGIKAIVTEGEISHIAYERNWAKADVELRFTQEKSKNGWRMMLVIRNKLKHQLYLDALMTIPGKEEILKTNVLPIEPNLSDFESWPHPIVQLVLRDFRFSEKAKEQTEAVDPKTGNVHLTIPIPAPLCWLRRPQPQTRRRKLSYDLVHESRGQVSGESEISTLMQEERMREASWILVLSCFVSLLVRGASAQDTSTPQERAQWVEITHKLESSPLDDTVDKQGEAVFKRLSDVHDVHVLLCPALLNEFNGMKYTYAHTITRQYMLASGEFQIENPDKADDAKATALAAVESVLKTYQAILQQKPDAKAKALDDLLKKQSHGKLNDALKQCP